MLRRLAKRLEGSDNLRLVMARVEATKRLEKAGFEKREAAQLLEALGLRGSALFATDPKPASKSVNARQLLEGLVATLEQYVVLPPGGAVAVALWIMFTYTFDAWVIAPILALLSPVMRCGKTTLVTLLAQLVRRALPASNITPAALFRTIDQYQPTLLIDEADTQPPNNDSLRSILNAGHTKPTAKVIRNVVVDGDWEPREFSVWGPKLLAGIGTMPATVRDRAITIPMMRKSPDENVKRLRLDHIGDALKPCRRKLARWAQDEVAELRAADPDLPEALHDRARDNWRPLLAIADRIGGEWPARARDAALTLMGRDLEDEAEAMVIVLLAGIQAVFERTGRCRLRTERILRELCEVEDGPWADWYGKPLTARQLAKLLAPFGIRPAEYRVKEKVVRGYRRRHFEEAFARYLPGTATPATPATDQKSGGSIPVVRKNRERGGQK